MPGAHATVHTAAIANASKASGIVVKLEAPEWMKILKRNDNPLVVIARGGMFRRKYQYLTTYRGLAFYTTSEHPLVLPGRAELVNAKSISAPEL